VANTAKLIGAFVAAALAVVLLAAVHVGWIDTGAEVTLVVSLFVVVHWVFRLVDDAEDEPPVV
jgi:hypothetical protein